MSLLEASPTLVQQHRDYQANLFVNRHDEIETVENKIRLVQSDQTVSDSIINYWGVGGIGKTWILRRLNDKFAYHDMHQDKYPTFALLFDFRNYDEKNLLVNFTKNLATQTLDQLASSPDFTTPMRQNLEDIQISKRERLEELAEAILGISQNFTPLILLDHTEIVEKASPELWEEIEKLFLEPIVSTGKVVVVVAGRRQIPRWRRFEVRRRVMESEKSQIKPFDKQGVNKQLARLDDSISADILYPYTAGNPQFVDAFARHIQLWKEKTETPVIDQEWINEHNNSLLKVLQLSKKELTQSVPTRLYQPFLSVISLRYYRLEAMRYMMTKQNQDFQSKPDSLYLQFVRDLAQETEIVWWDRARRAYVTSQVARKLINQTRYLEAPKEYMLFHNYALEMYWQWAQETPKTSDEFIIEILYHHAIICEVEKDINCLREQTAEVLKFTGDSLTTERILVLRNQIERDNELLELYSDEFRDELLGKLEELLNLRAG